MTQSLLEFLVTLAMLEKDRSYSRLSPGHLFDPLSTSSPYATTSEAAFLEPKGHNY